MIILIGRVEVKNWRLAISELLSLTGTPWATAFGDGDCETVHTLQNEWMNGWVNEYCGAEMLATLISVLQILPPKGFLVNPCTTTELVDKTQVRQLTDHKRACYPSCIIHIIDIIHKIDIAHTYVSGCNPLRYSVVYRHCGFPWTTLPPRLWVLSSTARNQINTAPLSLTANCWISTVN